VEKGKGSRSDKAGSSVMFSLFKKAAFTISDKVWMTKEECFKGLATKALKAITRKEIPIVISFFDDAAEEIKDYFKKQGVPYFDWKIESFGESDDQNVVYCAQAEEIEHLLKNNSRIAKSPLCFLLTGHHPMIATEDRLLNNVHTLTGASSFLFFLSFNSPLMEVFGVDNMKSLMQTLGMKQDECVEHVMITKSIARAREKIGQSLKSEIRTRNEREWYQKNAKHSR
jgi:hypothetical protein